jgi:thymidylate synthase
MKAYHELLHKIIILGEDCEDRTGVGTRSLFGEAMKFDLREGFPAVTTKKLAFKTMAAELAMFIRGQSDLGFLHERDCKIWDANAATYKGARFDGDLGRVYGVQWRDFQGKHGSTDQLKNLVKGLKEDPNGRRHIVTAWHPGELNEMCLPPCHIMFQCRIYDGYLDLSVMMRSLDMFLGAPFDIASYALLQELLAKECGLVARKLVMFVGDAHIYRNHMEQVGLMMSRDPFPLPELELSDTSIWDFDIDDAELHKYVHHPAIKAEMAV